MLTEENKEEIKKAYEKYKQYYIDFAQEILKFLQDFKIEDYADIADEIQSRSDNIKSIESILLNIDLNRYKSEKYNKLTDINDIAGTRITCHCKSDLDSVFNILSQEGSEKLKKSGYRVLIPKEEDKSYEDKLYRGKKLVIYKKIGEEEIACEIQMRTVLGNAWAVQNHKYIYKKELEGNMDIGIVTKALSDILFSCEGLWDLIKNKSKKRK